MKEKQKQITKNLAEKIKGWNDEQKIYLLGFVEGVTQFNKMEEKKKGE